MLRIINQGSFCFHLPDNSCHKPSQLPPEHRITPHTPTWYSSGFPQAQSLQLKFHSLKWIAPETLPPRAVPILPLHEPFLDSLDESISTFPFLSLHFPISWHFIQPLVCITWKLLCTRQQGPVCVASCFPPKAACLQVLWVSSVSRTHSDNCTYISRTGSLLF